MLINQSSDFIMPAFFDLKKDNKYLFTFNRRTEDGVNLFDCIEIEGSTRDLAIAGLKDEGFTEQEAETIYNESVK